MALYGGLVNEGLGSSDNNHGFLFNNDGSIYGHMAGVQDLVALGQGRLTISEQVQFIRTTTASKSMECQCRFTTRCTQRSTVKLYSIYTHEITTGFTLNNVGTMIGSIQCDAPNGIDIIVNRGAINGNINLGTGNDSYTPAQAWVE